MAGLTLSKTRLTYGSVRFGLTGIAAFGVTNHQSRTVNLSESFSGANHNDFSITGGTCASTLAAAKACSIIVTFKPGALGAESATLAVTASPDPLSPYNVALTTGPTIPVTVAPTSIAFGASNVSKTRNVTVTNVSPFSVSVGSFASGAFTVSGGSCGATLNGNSSCTIAVTNPAGSPQQSATLVVTVGNDPSSPYNVGLTSTGP
jgi:hypothetical protein